MFLDLHFHNFYSTKIFDRYCCFFSKSLKATDDMRRSGGGQENHRLKGSLNSITDQDSLENRKKLPRLEASIQCWAIISPPATRHLWRVAGGSIMAGFRGNWIRSPLISYTKQKQTKHQI